MAVVALLVLTAPPASAADERLFLMWDNCAIESQVIDKQLDCNAFAESWLYGSFKVAQPLPNFVGMDVSIDLQEETPNPAISPFYEYESGGCNATGIEVRHDNDFSSLCSGEGNPWGQLGSEAASSINFYTHDAPPAGPRRGRLLLSVYRVDVLIPAPLGAKMDIYAFHLILNTGRRGSCAGCTGRVAVVWNSAVLFSNDSAPPYVIAGPSNCATINGASPGTCAATPVRNTTWGQLKSLYR